VDVNRCLDEIGRHQHGLVTRPQLLDAGIDCSMLDRLRASGRLLPVQAGVYRLCGVPQRREQALLAVCLAAGEDAVVSHRAAVELWGLNEASAPVELTVPRSDCPNPRRAVLHRSTDLRPAHSIVRRGVPVTRPARTLVDYGAVVPFQLVADVTEVAIVRRLVTVSGLRAMLAEVARKGRSGCGPLRRVLDERPLGVVRSESVVESFFARLVKEFGVGAVEYQVKVVVDGQSRRLDYAIPAALLGIEIDSEEHHASMPARLADRRRTNQLATVGYQVLRYGSVELKRTPRRVIAEIRAVAAQRRALLGSGFPA